MLSPKQRYRILRRDSFKCQYCGKSADDGVKLEVDHIIPYALGGTDDEENLQVACFECNRGKTGSELIPDKIYIPQTVLNVKTINVPLKNEVQLNDINKKGITLKCTRKDCQKAWDYLGVKRYPSQVCCPNCGNKVRVAKEDASNE